MVAVEVLTEVDCGGRVLPASDDVCWSREGDSRQADPKTWGRTWTCMADMLGVRGGPPSAHLIGCPSRVQQPSPPSPDGTPRLRSCRPRHVTWPEKPLRRAVLCLFVLRLQAKDKEGWRAGARWTLGVPGQSSVPVGSSNVFTLELVPPDRPPASNRVASHRARNVWARSLLLSAPPPRAKCTVDLQGREAGQARGASNSKCDKTTLHGCNIILVNTQAPREEVAPEPNQA